VQCYTLRYLKVGDAEASCAFRNAFTKTDAQSEVALHVVYNPTYAKF